MSNDRLALGRQIYDYFFGKGLAPHQAAAIAGGMAWEGGGRIDLVNPGDNIKNSPRSPHSVGVGQWNDRLPALVDYARKSGINLPDGDLRDAGYVRDVARQLPLNTQLDFAWNEMQGPERRAYEGITSGQDLRSAAAGAISYHRPAGWTRSNPYAGHGFDNRVAIADQILRASQAGGASVPAPSGMSGSAFHAAAFPAPYALGGPKQAAEPVSTSRAAIPAQAKTPATEQPRAPAWDAAGFWEKQMLEGHADGGAVTLDEYRSAMPNDPLSAYRTQLKTGSDMVAPWDVPGTKSPVTGTLSNPAPRPGEYLAPAYEAVSPMVGGYGLAQGLADTAYALNGAEWAEAAKSAAPIVMSMFAGPGARTANKAALATAEQMAAKGLPREAIWKDTGWFQGPDKKWRFEVDDSGMKHAVSLKQWLDKAPDGSFRAPNLDAAYNVAASELTPHAPVRMKRIFDHLELDKAYPHGFTKSDQHAGIMGTPVQLIEGGNSAGMVVQAANPLNDVIGLHQSLTPGPAKSTALHEMQHRIQRHEGTNLGGSPFDKDLPTALDTAKEINARYAAELNDLQAKRDWDAVAALDEKRRAEVDKVLADGMLHGYRRLAGEVEARTVEKRMNMTPEERAARPPWLDYDVPESQQIVRMPSTGGSDYRRDYANGGRVGRALAIASKLVDRNPTDAQKESGNYAKGHAKVHGLDVTIENPKGSERSGMGKDGKRWSVKMPAIYGYVKGTEGFDGDHVDVYIGPDHDSKKVFVVDQINAEDGKFDEHKCLLSYPTKEAALADYRKAFSDGKADQRIGAVTEMTIDRFKSWVKSAGTQVPLGDIRKKYANGGAVIADEDLLSDYR